jgi:ABC-type proline/glycine betaine transport system permease subunit
LGTLLFVGVSTANYSEILAGSITVSALAIAANYLIRYFERRAEIAIHGKSR